MLGGAPAALLAAYAQRPQQMRRVDTLIGLPEIVSWIAPFEQTLRRL
jgi:hypothetical protein